MADPYNTISTFTARNKYFSTNLQEVLKSALVCEKICDVDRSDLYTIQNPYGSEPTASITGLTGTYSVTAWSTTNDALTVDMEVKYGEHVYDFQKIISNFDLFADRADKMAYAVGYKIDYAVLNLLTEAGTGTYTTPTGGFTTAANFNTICANLLSKTAGYSNVQNGLFLVIENTDLTGVIVAQGTNGFSMADAVLKNGFMNSWMGIDIYVVRTGTFADDTIGTTTVTNASHRVFGVKGVATYATPRSVQYDEKKVSGRTGLEISTVGLLGFKLWNNNASLIVDITLA